MSEDRVIITVEYEVSPKAERERAQEFHDYASPLRGSAHFAVTVLPSTLALESKGMAISLKIDSVACGVERVYLGAGFIWAEF